VSLEWRTMRGSRGEPLNLLSDVVMKVVSNATYNSFRIGDDSLCGSDDSGPCKVVDEVRRVLKKVLPNKEYKSLNDILDEFYAANLAKYIFGQ